MPISRSILLPVFTGVLCLAARIAGAQDDAVQTPPPVEVMISVADQKLVVLRDGGLIAKYPVSTSRFGVGDAPRSYKTPLGVLRVYNKIGDDLSPGAVIKHRLATGEVLAPNAPGRDPIVTREIWLEGTEEQNANARERAIYIHGTPEESLIGKPVSWGCIRMRSEDVIALYNQVGPGTEVDIMEDSLPHLHKYRPPPPPPAEKEGPDPGLLAKLWTKLGVKQEPPPVAEKPADEKPAPVADKPSPVADKPALAEKPLPPVAEKLEPIAAKPEPEKVASRSTPHTAPKDVNFHDSEWVASPKPSSTYDPNAWHAMKGSVLLADLPGTPAPAPKTPPVAEQTATAQVGK